MLCLVSKEKIWWYVINENKPSRKYMDGFLEHMQEADLRVNFNSMEDLEIVSKTKDITYIKFTYDNVDYFYIVKGIQKTLKNGYVLDVELDIWNTYTLPYLEELEKNNVEVLCNRSHLFNDNSIQFNDTLLDSVFKEYEDTIISKEYFSKSGDIYVNNNVGIKEDCLNANFYYVFNDGDNGNFTFIPLLKYKKEEIEIYSTKYESNNLYLRKYLNTSGYIDYRVDTSGRYFKFTQMGGNLDSIIIDAINKNKRCTYYGISKNLAYDKLNEINYSNLKIIDKNTLNPLTSYYSIIKTKVWHSSYPTNSWTIRYAFNSFKDNSIILESDVKTYPSVPEITYHEIYNALERNGGMIFVSVDEEVNNLIPEKVDNNKISIDEFRKSTEWSNKFLGVYLLPNALSINNLWVIKNIGKYKFLTLNLSYEQNNISINLGKINYSNSLSWNNKIISNKNILKYIYFNYYNNILDLRYYFNFNNNNNINISINGYINFTNTGNIFTKLRYTYLSNGIISFPDALPYGTDTYLNYVNATKNTVNTGYNIIKQQAIMSGVFGSLSGISSIVGGGIGLSNGIGFTKKPDNILPNITTTGRELVPYGYNFQNFGDVKSGFYKKGSNFELGLSSLGVGSGITKIASSITNSIMSVKQFENKMRAEYKDKNNLMGNKINLSQNEDAMWILANKEKGQYEPFEISLLSENCIKTLNNVIYLYGEYYPRIENISKILKIGDIFRYIQLDSNYLSLTTLQYLNAPRQFYEIVLNELENGVRIIDNIGTYHERTK